MVERSPKIPASEEKATICVHGSQLSSWRYIFPFVGCYVSLFYGSEMVHDTAIRGTTSDAVLQVEQYYK